MKSSWIFLTSLALFASEKISNFFTLYFSRRYIILDFLNQLIHVISSHVYFHNARLIRLSVSQFYPLINFIMFHWTPDFFMCFISRRFLNASIGLKIFPEKIEFGFSRIFTAIYFRLARPHFFSTSVYFFPHSLCHHQKNGGKSKKLFI